MLKQNYMYFNFRDLAALMLILTSVVATAQNFQAQAHYISKTSPDLDSWGGQQMSEAQKKTNYGSHAKHVRKELHLNLR
jgi:hypothetical protein